MGRVSVPIMNKTGYSMYWNSMWEDRLNYARSLKDDIFLKEFIYLFFEGGSYSTFSVNLDNYRNNLDFLKKKYFFHTKKIFKKGRLGFKSTNKIVINRKKSFNPYLSKIWILKYQTWIIIYFFAYSFNLSIFYTKKYNRIKKYSKYSNILFKYYNSIFKIKYNYNLFKKSCNFVNF